MCRSARPPELTRFVEWETGVSIGDEPYSIQLGVPSRRLGGALRMERHTGRSLQNDRIYPNTQKRYLALPANNLKIIGYIRRMIYEGLY